MATFHSTTSTQLPTVGVPSALLIPGDLYYATDTQQLFWAFAWSFGGAILINVEQLSTKLFQINGISGVNTFQAAAKSVSFSAVVANFYLVTTGSSVIDVTLPNPLSSVNQIIGIKKVDAGAGTVAIIGSIDGLTSFTLQDQWQYVEVLSDGTTWQIISRN